MKFFYLLVVVTMAGAQGVAWADSQELGFFVLITQAVIVGIFVQMHQLPSGESAALVFKPALWLACGAGLFFVIAMAAFYVLPFYAKPESSQGVADFFTLPLGAWAVSAFVAVVRLLWNAIRRQAVVAERTQ